MAGKRKWIIVSIVGTAAILVLGTIGGIVYAQSGSSTSSTATRTNPQTVLADKVAGILGLDNTTVENAFAQAQSEIQKDQVAAQLKAKEAQIDKMVTDGKLTEDQATQYKTWLESKPDVNVPGVANFGGPGRFGGGPGFSGKRGGHFGFGQGYGKKSTSTASPTPTPTPTDTTTQ